jgi:hypothetical protein
MSDTPSSKVLPEELAVVQRARRDATRGMMVDVTAGLADVRRRSARLGRRDPVGPLLDRRARLSRRPWPRAAWRTFSSASLGIAATLAVAAVVATLSWPAPPQAISPSESHPGTGALAQEPGTGAFPDEPETGSGPKSPRFAAPGAAAPAGTARPTTLPAPAAPRPVDGPPPPRPGGEWAWANNRPHGALLFADVPLSASARAGQDRYLNLDVPAVGTSRPDSGDDVVVRTSAGTPRVWLLPADTSVTVHRSRRPTDDRSSCLLRRPDSPAAETTVQAGQSYCIWLTRSSVAGDRNAVVRLRFVDVSPGDRFTALASAWQLS